MKIYNRSVLLRMILSIVWGIWKVRIEAEMLTFIARAHHLQPKIVQYYLLGVFTFGMSIAGIRHVDSWGITHPLGNSISGMSIAGIRHVDSWRIVPLTLVYTTEDSEHWGINGFYVKWSIVITRLSGMLAQFGSFRISSNSFFSFKNFLVQFVARSGNNLLFFQPGRIYSRGFVPLFYWLVSEI